MWKPNEWKTSIQYHVLGHQPSRTETCAHPGVKAYRSSLAMEETRATEMRREAEKQGYGLRTHLTPPLNIVTPN